MLEGFKYIKNIVDNVGTMHIYNQIGDSVDEKGNYVYGISGSSFAYEMQYLQNQCDTINVRINSIGGSVFDGYSIVSAILNSTKKVNCYIDGLAASMAGVIAVSGNKCYMADYGTLMLHNPQGGNDKAVLKLVKDTLVTILTNRTNQSEEEITNMMEKETWLNAKESLKLGMVDEIISSNKKIKMPKTTNLYDMALVYNKLINPIKNMSKINTLLKISNNADESEQENAIVNLNKQVEEGKSEIETLKNKLKELEDANNARQEAEKEALKNKATALVNQAVKEGKVKEDEVAETIENASKDEKSFLFVSNMIARLGNTKISQAPFNPKNVVVNGQPEDRSNWTYEDWETKDLSGLTNLYKNNREEYNKILSTLK